MGREEKEQAQREQQHWRGVLLHFSTGESRLTAESSVQVQRVVMECDFVSGRRRRGARDEEVIIIWWMSDGDVVEEEE